MAELDAKIEAAQERVKKLKAAKQKLESRARLAEKKKERTNDTRRKILAGAAIFDAVKNGKWTDANLKGLMAGYLTKPEDKALFGL